VTPLLAIWAHATITAWAIAALTGNSDPLLLLLLAGLAIGATHAITTTTDRWTDRARVRSLARSRAGGNRG
jgi:hypothetical protein